MHLRINVLTLCGVCLAFTVSAAELQLIEKIRIGEIREARASWWGFDAEDATDSLQAALTSGVARLIIDRQSSPWIVRPLQVGGNQEIFFEDGVEILAKKNEFHRPNDSLFSLNCVSNVTLRGYGATLRMRRDDYASAPYSKAEWRHILQIRACSNIQVLGLTLAESGGDGIYLGTRKGLPHNRDILIKDVICNKNYRQGISVISVENLLIENTVLSNTGGTRPAAGIDFEPNKPTEILKNVVMRGCVAHNNQGAGFLFALHQLRGYSEPVSIRLEKCRSSHDHTGLRMHSRNAESEAAHGRITMTDCVFENSQFAGVQIASKPEHGIEMILHRCLITGSAAQNPEISDIVLENRKGDLRPLGGLLLADCEVIQPVERPWIEWRNSSAVHDESIGGIKGRVTVLNGAERRGYDLNAAWLADQFPPLFATRVPHVAVDWSKAKVRNYKSVVKKLQPARIRKRATYYFYAESGDALTLSGQQIQVGRYEPADRPLILTAQEGDYRKTFRAAAFDVPVEVNTTVPTTGFYKLEVDVGDNAFMLKTANVPVALTTMDGVLNLYRSEVVFLLPVPETTELFAVDVTGDRVSEGVGVQIVSPEKKVAWKREAVTSVQRYECKKEEQQIGGLWRIRFMRPEHPNLTFEDFNLDVRGVPPFLFLNASTYWEF